MELFDYHTRLLVATSLAERDSFENTADALYNLLWQFSMLQFERCSGRNVVDFLPYHAQLDAR